jgi:predicted protein tyrosine phosphatase
MKRKVKVIRERDIERFSFEENSVLVFISYPDERIDENKFERYTDDYTVLFLEFSDNVPDPRNPDIEEGSCDLTCITTVLEFLEDDDIQTIYVCSTKSTARSGAMALGLRTAVGLESDEKVQNVLYEFVKEISDVLPNRWVVALFDYVLELNGKLVQALDDYSVTGMVINELGRTANGTWGT